MEYKTNSDKYKKTFELFKKLRVIKHPLILCEYGKIQPDEIEKIEKEKIPEIIYEKSGKEEFEQLLKDKTLVNYIKKYEEGIDEIYNEAIRRHNNVVSTHIPIWAWILLIFVGYKDVWRLLTGYGLIIIIILIGIFSILKMVGLGGTPLMILNLIKQQINSLMTKAKMD